MGERTKLGLWICLPLLAWVAVWIVALSMPVADCDGTGTEAGAEGVVLIALVAVASLATAAAALWRVVHLTLADALSTGRDVTLAGSMVLVLALAAILAGPRVEVLAVTGLALTGVALLALLVAWVAGLRVDRTGLLLPLYLLGAVVFAYPLVGLVGLLASSGIGC